MRKSFNNVKKNADFIISLLMELLEMRKQKEERKNFLPTGLEGCK